jgi:hypothetical protein
MKKLFLPILLLLFSSAYSLACSYAYQYSLFPLALAQGDTLIVLEVDLERYVSKPEDRLFQRKDRFSEDNNQVAQTRWKGYLRLKKQALGQWDSLLLVEELGYVDLADEQYQESLSPYFQKALDKAGQLPLSIVLEQPDLAYCYYDNQCQLFSRRIDTVNAEVFCLAANYPEHRMDIPQTIQSRMQAMLQSSVDVQVAASEWAKAWKPYSIRKYHLPLDKGELLVYTIGRGQKRFYQAKPPKSMWEPAQVNDLGLYLEGNDVLFHGQRIDGLQWVKNKKH